MHQSTEDGCKDLPDMESIYAFYLAAKGIITTSTNIDKRIGSLNYSVFHWPEKTLNAPVLSTKAEYQNMQYNYN